MTSRRSWTWRAARLVVLCAAGVALLATSPAEPGGLHALTQVEVDVPAGQIASLTVTAAGTAAAATQRSPVVPWTLTASLDTETTAPQVLALPSSGDEPIPEGDGSIHPDPCSPGRACVRRYRVLVAAPGDRPLQDTVTITASIYYDDMVDGVEMDGDNPPDDAALTLRVEGSGAPLVLPPRPYGSYIVGWDRAALVTRDRPVVEATVRQSFARSSIPPQALKGDRALLWLDIDMLGLAATEETAATASWTRTDGSPFAVFELGDEELRGGLVDVPCDESSCVVELDVTVRLEAGEWADFEVDRFYAAPADDAAPSSDSDSGLVEEGPPVLMDPHAA